MRRYYTMTTQAYVGTRGVVIDERCNAFTVYNAGTSKVIFNGMPILANASFEVEGNDGEFFYGRVELQFDGTGVTNPVNLVYVTQKIEVDLPHAILPDFAKRQQS